MNMRLKQRSIPIIEIKILTEWKPSPISVRINTNSTLLRPWIHIGDWINRIKTKSTFFMSEFNIEETSLTSKFNEVQQKQSEGTGTWGPPSAVVCSNICSSIMTTVHLLTITKFHQRFCPAKRLRRRLKLRRGKIVAKEELEGPSCISTLRAEGLCGSCIQSPAKRADVGGRRQRNSWKESSEG